MNNKYMKYGKAVKACMAVALSVTVLATAGCSAIDLPGAYDKLRDYISEKSAEQPTAPIEYAFEPAPPSEDFGIMEDNGIDAVPEAPEADTPPNLDQLPRITGGGFAQLALGAGTTSVSDVFKKVENSVVSINTKQTGRSMFYGMIETESAGSGIVYHQDDENIYISTNYHVISGANAATISLDDLTTVSAHYVGGYPDYDLALISVSKADLQAAGITNIQVAKFGNSDAVGVGDFVMAVGNALGEGKSATFGIISALGKTIETGNGKDLEALQTDAAINPGNSGGPLIDMSGQVIGINTAKYADYAAEGIGFAIPSSSAAKVLNELLAAGGPVLTPYLGVYSVEITDEIKTYYNLPSYGLYINSTVTGATAHTLGLRNGDIITEINGMIIRTNQDLSDAINKVGVGNDLTVEIVRVGRGVSQEQTLTGKLLGQSQDQTNF